MQNDHLYSNDGRSLSIMHQRTHWLKNTGWPGQNCKRSNYRGSSPISKHWWLFLCPVPTSKKTSKTGTRSRRTSVKTNQWNDQHFVLSSTKPGGSKQIAAREYQFYGRIAMYHRGRITRMNLPAASQLMKIPIDPQTNDPTSFYNLVLSQIHSFFKPCNSRSSSTTSTIPCKHWKQQKILLHHHHHSSPSWNHQEHGCGKVSRIFENLWVGF